jgi:3-keto-5-aminohexanoate cleavage enzyme
MNHPNTHLPLVIEVRGNEFASPSDNPHVPLGAEAIIADAVDCAAAGAAGYHWHARRADGIDRPDDIELHRTVTRGLRDTGLILHPTLGFTSTQGEAAYRLRTVAALNADPATRVDIVPVDIGAFIL